jgi:hypothetical protein
VVRTAAKLIIIVVAALLGWHVAWLKDCRELNDRGPLREFVREGCPKDGPYGPQDNVVYYALSHLLDPLKRIRTHT